MLTHALCDGLGVAEGEEDHDERREEGRLDEIVAAQAAAEKVVSIGRPTAVGFPNFNARFE